MEILFVLIPLALGLSSTMVVFFILAARSGQFDDLETPAHRMLIDDKEKKHDN